LCDVGPGSREEVAADWRATEPDHDARVAVLPDGRVVGWAALADRGLHAGLRGQAHVHPDVEGRGVAGVLVRWTEERAAGHAPLAPEGIRVVLHHECHAEDARARGLFRALGYREIRRVWGMRIGLDPAHPPAAPARPDGIAVRAAAAQAFRDTWGHVPRTFEQWVGGKKRHGHDPELWLSALDGDEIAGALAGAILPQTRGWIHTVAVRRPWRRGLAMALLREAFRRLAERGASTVALGVDATSPTGATRLYEQAGTRVTQEFVVDERELRPGVAPGWGEGRDERRSAG
jgi:ribosomal protein S18 acetylase RimI-like enzyme